NRAWGSTSARLGMFALTPEYIASLHPMYAPRFMPDKFAAGSQNRLRWEVDRERGVVRMNDPKSAGVTLEFPLQPMLGCVGVAPGGDFSPTSGPAGSYGG